LSTSKPVPLKELLGDSDTTVGRLITRCAEIDAITNTVRRLLPDDLKPHLLAANESDVTLCLVADSSVWAAKMRYHAADILISLSAAQGRSLQKIRVTVAAGAC